VSRERRAEVGLFPETLDAVRDRMSFVSLVGELRYRKREGLKISGDSQWPSVHRFKTLITNENRRDVFRAVSRLLPVPRPGRAVDRKRRESMGR
jgi:hypothetical protein